MLVKHEGKDVKLPDFLIVGAAKSGTTSLHYYLKQHPQIFLPKVKELFFFPFLDAPQNAVSIIGRQMVVSHLDDYLTHFKGAKNGQLIGEACPVYLFEHRDTIRNIKKVYSERYKDLKIIIILRNPAEVAWSHFMMFKRDGKEPLKDFREAIKSEVISKRRKSSISFDYIGYGMYYEQVLAYVKEFPQIKIFLYDDLCSDALGLVKEMFQFLGVDEGFIPDVEKKYNISGNVKFKWLNAVISKRYPLKGILKSFLPYETRQRIKFFIQGKTIQRCGIPDDIRKELSAPYKDDILNLQKLINKDLSSWLF